MSRKQDLQDEQANLKNARCHGPATESNTAITKLAPWPDGVDDELTQAHTLKSTLVKSQANTLARSVQRIDRIGAIAISESLNNTTGTSRPTRNRLGILQQAGVLTHTSGQAPPNGDAADAYTMPGPQTQTQARDLSGRGAGHRPRAAAQDLMKDAEHQAE